VKNVKRKTQNVKRCFSQ